MIIFLNLQLPRLWKMNKSSMTYMKMSYWLIYTVYTVHTQQYIILYMCLIDSCLINLIYSAPFVLTPVSFVLCCLLYIISYMVSYWLYHYCNFELLTRFPQTISFAPACDHQREKNIQGSSGYASLTLAFSYWAKK